MSAVYGRGGGFERERAKESIPGQARGPHGPPARKPLTSRDGNETHTGVSAADSPEFRQ
jgi:hypothetical protein